MDLEKYKLCPMCQEHNPPSLLECRKCETDLTGVKVADSTTEQSSEAPIPVQDSETQKIFRLCDCGEKNPPQARKCRACGEDISDLIPERHEADALPFSYALHALDDSFQVTIDKPVIIIGREVELKEYLASKGYVSRQHAKLTIVAQKVFIENLSNTNNTYVNNILIPNDHPTALNDADEIGLGGISISEKRQEQAAYFIFRVQPCI